MRKIWPFSFYFLYFAAFSSFLPYIVLFYQQLGFNGTQIGLLTGIPPLITLFGAPFGTGLADATQRHKLIMGVGIAVTVAVGLLLPGLTRFSLVFTMIVFLNLFGAPISPLGDSATMTMLGEKREMYGRIRLGGTIGWGMFAQIAGVLLFLYGLKILFQVFSVIMLINLFVIQKFSFGEQYHEKSNNSSMRILLTDRRWIVFLVLGFLGGLGSFSVPSYLSPYLQELGANGSQIGFAFLLPTLLEIPVFFFSNHLVRRYKSYTVFVVALILTGIRAILFGLIPNIFLLIIIQGVGGAIFPALWAAGVSYADENAPAGFKSTGQGLFGAMMFGFGAAFSGFVGGLLLERFGGSGVFLVFGVIILAGLLVVLGVNRMFSKSSVVQ